MTVEYLKELLELHKKDLITPDEAVERFYVEMLKEYFRENTTIFSPMFRGHEYNAIKYFDIEIENLFLSAFVNVDVHWNVKVSEGDRDTPTYTEIDDVEVFINSIEVGELNIHTSFFPEIELLIAKNCEIDV